MNSNTLKIIGVICIVICAVLLFVAVERYQTNAKNVRAMNSMTSSAPFGNSGPFGNVGGFNGQFKAATPAATKYAAVFAFVFAGAAVACFVIAGKAPALPVAADQNQNQAEYSENKV